MTSIQKFDTNIEKKKRFSFKLNVFASKKYIYFAMSSLLFLVIFEIWVNNTLASFGSKYENISMLQQSIKLENQVLENELALQTSLVNIATQSSTLGFSKPKQIQYIR